MSLWSFFGLKKESGEHETESINKIIIQESPRGSSGVEIYAGYIEEDYLEGFKGTERADKIDKMRRSDAQVKMLLSSVKNPIRTATREIISASDDIEHKKHAELCRQVLFKDIKFNKFLNESLTMIDFGHSVFEKVHQKNIEKPIKDDEGNAVLSSYIGLKNLGWRSPRTIETWNFNTEKEFVGITQQADGDLGAYTDIPKEHLIILSLEQEGDNYEGMSMLRPCYGNYFRKNVYLKLNAIGIEKSMPIPTAEVPSGQENSQQYSNLIKSLVAFTTHQKNYLTYPAGWKIQLSNGTNYDPDKVEQSIENEDKRMAKAFLANFLELGMGSGGGAYALGKDLSDFFLGGLVYISGIIKEELDEVIKELVIINFGEQEKYPEFSFSGIEDKAGDELAKVLESLARSKIIIPDDNLEHHVRKRYKLSPKSEEGQRETKPEPQQGQLSLAEKIDHAVKEKRKLLGQS